MTQPEPLLSNLASKFSYTIKGRLKKLYGVGTCKALKSTLSDNLRKVRPLRQAENASKVSISTAYTTG